MPEEGNEHSEPQHGSGGERKELLPATHEDLRKIQESAVELGGQKSTNHEILFDRARIVIEHSTTEGDPGDIEDYSGYLPVASITVDTEEGALEIDVKKTGELVLKDYEIEDVSYPEVTLTEGQAKRVIAGLRALQLGDEEEGRRLILSVSETDYFPNDDSEQDSNIEAKVLSHIKGITQDGQTRIDVFKAKDLISDDEEIGRSRVAVTTTEITPDPDVAYLKAHIIFTKFNEDDSARLEVEYHLKSDGVSNCYERLHDTHGELAPQVKQRNASRVVEDSAGLSETTHGQAEFILKLLEEAKKS